MSVLTRFLLASGCVAFVKTQRPLLYIAVLVEAIIAKFPTTTCLQLRTLGYWYLSDALDLPRQGVSLRQNFWRQCLQFVSESWEIDEKCISGPSVVVEILGGCAILGSDFDVADQLVVQSNI